MLSESRTKHWQRIVDLSNQMYEFAQQQEWQMVQQIEEDRQKKIMLFFGSDVPVSEAGEMRQNIKQLLESDKALMQSSLGAKVSIGDSLHTLGKGQKAAGVYAAHTGDKLR